MLLGMRSLPLAALIVVACAPPATSPCEFDEECRPGFVCVEGRCVEGTSVPNEGSLDDDAGAPHPDVEVPPKDGGAPHASPTDEDGGIVEDGGVDREVDPALFAVSPALAEEGSTVLFEGGFPGPTTVRFPSGATAGATLLGSRRATVVVPAGAARVTIAHLLWAKRRASTSSVKRRLR